ncbi:MAG: pyroglutamyl-peptidase I [Candidatus Eisenbacteria bacterium]|uniref:Pyroglutamyl-peptidase I n=1 Tax=Eiseniibacteriota bacterium TaxID=2212470 RepID=A0A7Y2EA35_UNCEI|nr:pyroglutamyl-peptidase I [Candidatus Eisenbacteria bacterium]
MPKVLLTGFEPFDGASSNPSQVVVETLGKGHQPSCDLKTLVLPVDRKQAAPKLLSAMRSHEPDLVLMMGVAPRPQIAPERVAINVDDYRIPDNAGNQPAGVPIIEGGPVAYFSSLPVKAIETSLRAHKVPCTVSNSAGTYLCNHVFYQAMHFIATNGLQTKAGFIHLPFFHEHVIDQQKTPSLAEGTVVEGIDLALETCLAAVQVSAV